MIIERINSFSLIEDSWNALLLDSTHKTIFQTYEWQSTWWKHFGNNKELFLLVARDGTNTIGIAPLMIETMRVKGIPFFRTIKFIGTGLSDYLNFILRDGHEDQAFQGFIDHLIDNKSKWDLMWLSEVPGDSSTNELLAGGIERSGLAFTSEELSKCPYIKLPPTWEEYEGSLSRTTRKNIKMYSNRIAKGGDLRHHIVTDKAEIPLAINDFFRLQENRWHGVQKGHTRSIAIKNFHQDAAATLSSFVNIYFLIIGDTRAACMYSYDFNSTRYFYWIAWDKQFEHYSPGFITTINQIKDAVNKRYKVFDFMRGDEPYKYHFTKTERINMRYFVSHSKAKFKLFHLIERLSNK